MTDQLTQEQIAESLAPFSNVDLKCVAARVAKEYPDWSQERHATAEQEYRRWLCLCKIKPTGTILGMGATPGSKDVDEFWHMHILFTRKYASDCNQLIGEFLHHQPASDKDKGDRSSFISTQKLYFDTFGEKHPTWFAQCADDNCYTQCTKCTAACGGTDCGCRATGTCNQCN